MVAPTREGIEGKDPMAALSAARYCCYVGMATSAALTLLAPVVLPTVGVGSFVMWIGGTFLIRKEILKAQKAQEEMGKGRAFQFTDKNEGEMLLRNMVPEKKDASGKLAVKKYWNPEWVPFQMRKRPDNYNGREVMKWRKELFTVDPGWMTILEAQNSWLKQYFPGRFKLVNKWWFDGYVGPLLKERHGSASGCTKEQMASAAKAMEVELRIGISIAGQPQLWNRRLGVGYERRTYDALTVLLHEMSESEPVNVVKAEFPRYKLPVYDQFYLGKGFYWDQKHTQKMYDLRHKPESDQPVTSTEQGDPRLFGIGIEAGTPEEDLWQFIAESQFNQHTGIFGTTGVGKTRFVEPITKQVIRSGFPCIVIDPKGDRELTDRTAEECRREGRGHQFRYVTLLTPTRPETYEWLSTMNTMSGYGHFSELASRMASVIPEANDKFWKTAATSMAYNCAGLCDCLMRYLTFIGRDEKGKRLPKWSREVPEIILAMTYAAAKDGCTPEEARIAVQKIRQKVKDPTWIPGPDERSVMDVIRTVSLDKNPIYSPMEWNPTVRQMSEYEIDNTVPFLGWALKIFFYHLYVMPGKFAKPDFPRLAADPEIKEKSTGNPSFGSMWSIYSATRFHPLEIRFTPNSEVQGTDKRWLEFYNYFVPDNREDHYLLDTLFKEFRKVLENHFSDCNKERKEFIREASTLSGAIKPFSGEKGRIVCSLDPDFMIDRVVEDNHFVYFAPGSLVDPVGSSTICKMLVESIRSFAGEALMRKPENKRALYIICDEIGQFINEPMISLLNQGRGVGIRIILIGQTLADLQNALGSKEKAEIVLGNLNTIIQLRPQLENDAKVFINRLKKVNIEIKTRGSSLTPAVGKTGPSNILDFGTNESENLSLKDVVVIDPGDLMSLPKFHAFVHAEAKIRLVAQGFFNEVLTRFQEEIGVHPGDMREMWEPQGGWGAWAENIKQTSKAKVSTKEPATRQSVSHQSKTRASGEGSVNSDDWNQPPVAAATDSRFTPQAQSRSKEMKERYSDDDRFNEV